MQVTPLRQLVDALGSEWSIGCSNYITPCTNLYRKTSEDKERQIMGTIRGVDANTPEGVTIRVKDRSIGELIERATKDLGFKILLCGG